MKLLSHCCSWVSAKFTISSLRFHFKWLTLNFQRNSSVSCTLKTLILTFPSNKCVQIPMKEPIITSIKKCPAFIVKSSKTPASDILQAPLTCFPTCYFFMEGWCHLWTQPFLTLAGYQRTPKEVPIFSLFMWWIFCSQLSSQGSQVNERFTWDNLTKAADCLFPYSNHKGTGIHTESNTGI